MFRLKNISTHPLFVDSEVSNASDLYSDVWIKGDSGNRFAIHRLILGASSPHLLSILQEVPTPDVCILLPDVEHDAVKLLLEFIYHGELECLSESGYHNLFELMQLLEIDCANNMSLYGDDLDADATADDDPQDNNNDPYDEPFAADNDNNNTNIDNACNSLDEYPENLSLTPIFHTGEELLDRKNVIKRSDLFQSSPDLGALDGGDSPAEYGRETSSSPFATSVTAAVADGGADAAELMLSCRFCDRCFSSASHLEKHVRYSHNCGTYACQQCSFSTNFKASLKNHVSAVHAKIKNYGCATCEKKFSSKADLKRHEIGVHLRLRPYRCDFCQASFSQKSNLTIHVRTHTGEKPYCCKYCSKSFGELGSLKSHESTHQ